MVENEGFHGDLTADWPNVDHLNAAEFLQTAEPDLDLNALATRVAQRMGNRESPSTVLQWLRSLTDERRTKASYDAIIRTKDPAAMMTAIDALPDSAFKWEAARIHAKGHVHRDAEATVQWAIDSGSSKIQDAVAYALPHANLPVERVAELLEKLP